MIPVTNTWRANQNDATGRLPTYVRATFFIGEEEAMRESQKSYSSNAPYASPEKIVAIEYTAASYVTAEPNYWLGDGSQK